MGILFIHKKWDSVIYSHMVRTGECDIGELS